MGFYPNAAKGLKMMFWAQIVSIIASMFSAIPLIGVVGSLASFLCALITVAGVYVAGKDDEGFKKAFILTIASVVLSLIAALLSFIPVLGTLLSSLVGVLTSILELIVKFYIITTIAGILRNIGAHDVADRGKTVWRIVMFCTIAGAIISILMLIPIINIIASVFAFVVAIVEVVGSILYLIYLYKSYNVLGA